MRRIVFISIVLVLFSLVFIPNVLADCSNVPVCGVVPPNSNYGFGLVEICGECFACGVPDGVCPEDFINNGKKASCRQCPDEDCKVNISGRVVLDGRPNSRVEKNLDIYYFHNSAPANGILLNTTFNNATATGYFNGIVPSGNIYLMVIDDDFDSEYVLRTFVRGEVYNNIIIEITEGVCNSDCTGAYGLVCKKGCQGKNNCSYLDVTFGNNSKYSRTAIQIANLCDGVLKGNERYLNSDDSFIYNYVCCDGGVRTLQKQAINIGVGSGPEYEFIKDLRSTAIPVTYRGQIYNLVLSVWKSN